VDIGHTVAGHTMAFA